MNHDEVSDTTRFGAPECPLVVCSRVSRDERTPPRPEVVFTAVAGGAILVSLPGTYLIGQPKFYSDGELECELDAPGGRCRVRVHPDFTFITHPHDYEARPLANLAVELGTDKPRSGPSSAPARRSHPGWGLLALLAVFCAIAIWAIVTPPRPGRHDRIWAMAGLVVFGASFVASVRDLRRK